MADYRVGPTKGPLDAVVSVPGSKSLTNRALVAAALARGRSTLNNVLFADDSRLMIEALGSLGVAIRANPSDRRAVVQGCGGHLPRTEADLYCGNAGTVMRFLAAVCAAGIGSYRLDGSARMRERPIRELLDAAQRLGARVQYEQAEGFAPFRLLARGLHGGHLEFRDPPSSQMISGLLLAAPLASDDVFVSVEGNLPSVPYLAMTVAVMEAFGVSLVEQNLRRFIVPAPQLYQACEYSIEPDASNASYFLAAAAVTGGCVTVRGLSRHSVQGDARFVELLARIGCRVDWSTDGVTVRGPAGGRRLAGLDADLNDMPDMVQTLAIIALFADGPTTIRNVGSLRVKETDRLAALAAELSRMGAHVRTAESEIHIEPPASPRPTPIETYDDHRMAMSFAIAGLVVPGVVIRARECVNKTFPEYFDTLESLSGGGNP